MDAIRCIKCPAKRFSGARKDHGTRLPYSFQDGKRIIDGVLQWCIAVDCADPNKF